MQDNFWTQLAKPIIGLSPMDGVTDHPFRHIQKKYGPPDVVYTEFTNVEGLCHGADRLLREFIYDETQRPIIAQIYGKTPEYFRQATVLVCELGFDGVDINMGCPAKNVANSGCGAALIRNPKLAQEIIKAVQLGVEGWVKGVRSRDCADIEEKIWQKVEARHNQLPVERQRRRQIPVSVKTRVGFDQPVIEEWISTLLELKPAAIALHGRTLKQQYSGQASWELIAQAAQLVKKTDTLILGNGDVESRADALEKVKTYSVDGVLIGRASFGNPFVFSKTNAFSDKKDEVDRDVELKKKLAQIALEHAQLYEQSFGSNKHYSFLPMRKHLGWYIKGLPQAKEIRLELLQTNSSQEVAAVLHKFNLI